jgi:response regulator RpfG family c-di-GMP phosphodiesterase
MIERILCVDDEPNVLEGYKRQLRKQFDITIMVGGKEGLAAIKEKGPFAVIVSDMRMPEMNGAQFLSRARELAPDTVRMLLTGQSEMQATIDAVNEGNIFRFLSKPCPPEVFSKALLAGIHQYRLVTAERELLEKTLRGSIGVLTEVLGLVSPLAFGKASRVQRLVQQINTILQVPNPWLLEVAAMLSQIGCVAIPDTVLAKIYEGKALAEAEASMFSDHPRVGHDLIKKIPRLEFVAEVIAAQDRHFSDSGTLVDGKTQELSLEARILKVALDCDTLETHGHDRKGALKAMKARTGWYDPYILEALDKTPDDEGAYEPRTVPVSELFSDMVLNQDLLTSSGALIVRKGQKITEALLHRLNNLSANRAVSEPVAVLVPLALLQN